jgi:hypothetical protein
MLTTIERGFDERVADLREQYQGTDTRVVVREDVTRTEYEALTDRLRASDEASVLAVNSTSLAADRLNKGDCRDIGWIAGGAFSAWHDMNTVYHWNIDHCRTPRLGNHVAKFRALSMHYDDAPECASSIFGRFQGIRWNPLAFNTGNGDRVNPPAHREDCHGDGAGGHIWKLGRYGGIFFAGGSIVWEIYQEIEREGMQNLYDRYAGSINRAD